MSPQQLVDALSSGGLYALVALGIALIFGIMRLVNFAHGDLMMVGGYVILVVGGVPWPLILIATCIFVTVVALVMERVAFRPLRDANPSTLLVSSFAVSILIQSIVIAVFGVRAKGVAFGASLNKPVEVLGLRAPIVDLVTLATAIVLMLALLAFLRWTAIGVQIRAAAEDFTMTRLLGVDANRVIATAFAVSGVFAAVAAILVVANTGTLTPTFGIQPVLIAFVATVIGGMGSLLGAAAGGFILGALGVALQTALPLEARGYRDAILFAIVIAILLFRPAGLFSTGVPEERV